MRQISCDCERAGDEDRVASTDGDQVVDPKQNPQALTATREYADDVRALFGQDAVETNRS